MNNLFILLVLPLVGAIFLPFIKNIAAARWGAILLSLIQLAITAIVTQEFVPNAEIQFEEKFAWISSLNIGFHIGIDGISLPLVILTNGLIPLILISTFSKSYKSVFYALVFFMQVGLLLVFTALDAFTFYVGWEVALIPIYFICSIWGGEKGIRINLKFFIYTFFGSLLMLIAILYLYQQTPNKDFEWLSFTNLALDGYAQRWIFWAFFLAFAIKIPIFPFHTWQPDTYTNAPTAGTMLLSGIMLKMGTYGLIRWLVPIAPIGVANYSTLIMVLCVVGIVYASIIALKQKNMKRLVAYSSIAHVGLIAAGIFAWNIDGLQGALMQMVNHGISAFALFYVLDIIAERTGSRDLSVLGGLAVQMPKLAIFFLIVIMAAVGLPLTNGFIGEFLLLKGIYSFNIWYAVFAGLTLVLGAVYMLRLYQKSMLGTLNAKYITIEDIKGHEVLVLVVVSVIIIYLGIMPNTLLHLSELSVQQLLQSVKF